VLVLFRTTDADAGVGTEGKCRFDGEKETDFGTSQNQHRPLRK
jgi:hypothetical protein